MAFTVHFEQNRERFQTLRNHAINSYHCYGKHGFSSVDSIPLIASLSLTHQCHDCIIFKTDRKMIYQFTPSYPIELKHDWTCYNSQPLVCSLFSLSSDTETQMAAAASSHRRCCPPSGWETKFWCISACTRLLSYDAPTTLLAQTLPSFSSQGSQQIQQQRRSTPRHSQI